MRDTAADDPARVAVERAAAHLTKSAKQKRRLARKQENRRADREASAVSQRAAAYFNPSVRLPADPHMTQSAASLAETRSTSAADKHDLRSLPMSGEHDAQSATALGADKVRELRNQRRCYVCKQPFRRLHAFYHALCLMCAERNFAARTATADLTGRRAIVTGGRIKIGFEIAVSLLHAGARVTVTTRFPRDAEQRYATLAPELRERLTIVGLDFLDLRGVSAWIQGELARGEPFDILINNAAQTVRRPAAYYARLAAAEQRPAPLEGRISAPDAVAGAIGDARPIANSIATVDSFERGESHEGATDALDHGAARSIDAELHAIESSVPLADLTDTDEALALLFPDRVDAEGKPVDLRHRNSWVMDAAEVEPAEVAEVHVVNAIVPFLIASRLRPLMVASPFADRYIVNVSAMEGVFAYRNKQTKHPHTNMAKAALNMFTRTSAPEFLADGIYLNSVDTGWITQENPHPLEERLKSTGFCPPLDIVDGAARVLAPVYRGVTGDRVAGAFFKDYEPAPW